MCPGMGSASHAFQAEGPPSKEPLAARPYLAWGGVKQIYRLLSQLGKSWSKYAGKRVCIVDCSPGHAGWSTRRTGLHVVETSLQIPNTLGLLPACVRSANLIDVSDSCQTSPVLYSMGLASDLRTPRLFRKPLSDY